MKKLDDVRENLIDMLEDLDERLGKITADVRHIEEPLSGNFSEQAADVGSSGVLYSPRHTARDELIEVRGGYKKRNSVEYRVCVICGDVIKNARLELLPSSDKCIKCAQVKAEKR